MKKLLLAPMVAIALTSIGASAASSNLRHEFTPEEGEADKDEYVTRYRISLKYNF